ncbi:UPF0213 protein DP2720 [Chlamydiales bacterium SCGC AG-110-P3]|nr:UPF0213 protein DP2720 [Chlamydiales bacterium SCGC AG-110-P3]
MTKKKEWTVYIIEAESGKLYTGITTDMTRRWNDHSGGKSGARFFRTSKPSRIAYQEVQPDRAAATRREISIKRMTRKQKLVLIRHAPSESR